MGGVFLRVFRFLLFFLYNDTVSIPVVVSGGSVFISESFWYM